MLLEGLEPESRRAGGGRRGAARPSAWARSSRSAGASPPCATPACSRTTTAEELTDEIDRRLALLGRQARLRAAGGVRRPWGGRMSGTLTDVAGLTVGHWTDRAGGTGCTVVLCDGDGVGGRAWTCAGRRPARARPTCLEPVNAVQRVHAVLIGGGSAFGLDACPRRDGAGWRRAAAAWRSAPARADRPRRRALRPARRAAGRASGCRRRRGRLRGGVGAPVPQGCVGAGTGATVGKLLGFAARHQERPRLGQLRLCRRRDRAARSWPSMPPATWSTRRAARSWPAEASRRRVRAQQRVAARAPAEIGLGGSTTLAVVATDAELTKAEAAKVARMAHDGLARTIDPVHTTLDGDTVFALAPAPPARAPTSPTVGGGGDRAAEAVLAACDAASSATTPSRPGPSYPGGRRERLAADAGGARRGDLRRTWPSRPRRRPVARRPESLERPCSCLNLGWRSRTS